MRDFAMLALDAPFVDGHVHFWDLTRSDLKYAWLSPGAVHPMLGDIEGLKVRRYAVDEFVAQSRFHHVSKAVHVSVSTNDDPVLETRWLQAQADKSGYPQAIVAKCDLAHRNAEETLLHHLESPNMRGVRDNGQPGSFRDRSWRNGFRLLAKYNLVFCHEVGVERMDEAVELVRTFPEVQFCLDHCAMPRVLDEDGFRNWRTSLTSIASAPNVTVKISALGQWGRKWTAESARPWVLTCIETFGIKRAFFGSNFPVDGLFSGYGDLIEAFRGMIADYPEGEQQDLLARNAERVFRI
jgi:predicted TIM-barrel fold metal-dependent hydrolase